MAGLGEELKQVQNKIALLKEENQQLRFELLSGNRLADLKQLAEEKGFTSSQKIINLSAKVPVALNR